MEFIIENIKLLIGIVVAVLWFIGKAAENKKNAGEEEPWIPEEQEEPAEDHKEARPPPMPPTWQAAPPPLPEFIPAAEGELERQRQLQERLRNLRKERADVPATTRHIPKPKPAKPVVAAPVSLKSRLRNRNELRRAIIMREILDPPVGLR